MGIRSNALMNSNPATLRGALWMGGAVLSFSAMAIAVRELQRNMGSFEILFLRSVVMLLIVAAMAPPRCARSGSPCTCGAA